MKAQAAVASRLLILVASLVLSGCGSDNPEDGDPPAKKHYCFEFRAKEDYGNGFSLLERTGTVRPSFDIFEPPGTTRSVQVRNVVESGCDEAPSSWSITSSDPRIFTVALSGSGFVRSIVVTLNTAGDDVTANTLTGDYYMGTYMGSALLQVNSSEKDYDISGNLLSVVVKHATAASPKEHTKVVGFPTKINFGRLKVGLSRTRFFIAINAGKSTVSVSSVGVRSETGSAFSTSAAPFDIEPSGSGVVLVTFTPPPVVSSPGDPPPPPKNYSGSLAMTLKDQIVFIPLEGIGVN